MGVALQPVPGVALEVHRPGEGQERPWGQPGSRVMAGERQVQPRAEQRRNQTWGSMRVSWGPQASTTWGLRPGIVQFHVKTTRVRRPRRVILSK